MLREVEKEGAAGGRDRAAFWGSHCCILGCYVSGSECDTPCAQALQGVSWGDPVCGSAVGVAGSMLSQMRQWQQSRAGTARAWYIDICFLIQTHTSSAACASSSCSGVSKGAAASSSSTAASGSSSPASSGPSGGAPSSCHTAHHPSLIKRKWCAIELAGHSRLLKTSISSAVSALTIISLRSIGRCLSSLKVRTAK